VRPSSSPAGQLRVKAEEIASNHAVRIGELLGRGGNKKIFAARRELAMYLRGIGKSYPKIGELLGRDHTSIMSMAQDGYRAAKYERTKACAAARRANLSPAPQELSSAQADH
jgi:hypothetical protein